ncbi:MAG: AAA family ATPase [Flavobacteriales bacterium]
MTILPQEFKERIIEAIRANREQYSTNKAHALYIGIDPAQYSRISKGETEGVLSDKNWNEIATLFNVPFNPNSYEWQIANTLAYQKITKQLKTCQNLSISGIFCDISDIGKTFTAKDYVKRERNAVLIDCSRNKSRTELLRAISRSFGIDSNSQVKILQQDLIQYMRSMTKPLVILDEFGDLSYPAFLEIKALWNATEYKCGWYMMGADGLQVKLDRQKELKKVGYAEIFSRLGSRYQRVTPIDEFERQKFLMYEIDQIVKANDSNTTALQMYAKTNGSLRRVYIEITKEKSGLLEDINA